MIIWRVSRVLVHSLCVCAGSSDIEIKVEIKGKELLPSVECVVALRFVYAQTVRIHLPNEPSGERMLVSRVDLGIRIKFPSNAAN